MIAALPVLLVVFELFFVPPLRLLLHSPEVILHSSDEVFEISRLAMTLLAEVRPALVLLIVSRVTEALLVMTIELVIVTFAITIHSLSSSLLLLLLFIPLLFLAIAESLEVLVSLLLLLS